LSKRVDLAALAAKAFGDLLDNPLKDLEKPDQTLLYSMLLVYSAVTTRVSKGPSDDDSLEGVAKLVANAADLGLRLESEVFHGPDSDVFLPFISSFSDLPRGLAEFSKLVGGVLDLIGKPGHKGRNLTNQLLIQASEFVQLKTGEYHDGHLAELYKAILESSPTEDLSFREIQKMRKYVKEHYRRLNVDALDTKQIVERYYAGVDLSDVIRKKRERIQKYYPDLYSLTLDRARRLCESTVPRDSP